MSKPQTNQYPITKELVDNIKHRLSFGLSKGLGKPKEGKMCIEAVICAAYNLPHSDNPPCVGETFRQVKIALNDCDWPSNEARAKGMEKIAIAQLGSNTLNQDEAKERLFHKSCQKLLPLIIAVQINDDRQKNQEEDLKGWVEKFKSCSLKNCKELWKEFYNYYNCYYYNYNNYYNCYYNCYNYYCYCYCYCYYYNYKIPNFLEAVAETILEVLQDMKSPGCEWLEK